MDIQKALVMLHKLDPEGFNKLNQQLTQHVLTAGANLTIEQAMFVKANFAKLPEWLATTEGKETIKMIVDKWQSSQSKVAAPSA